MRQLDFYKLTRPVQERFLGSTRGAGSPTPILVTPARPPLPWLSAAGVVLSALVLLGVMAVGYGDLGSSVALAPFWLLLIYALCVAVGSYSGYRAIQRFRVQGQLPFRPATYLFPVGVVEARASKISIYPLTDLRDIQVNEGSARLRLAFSSGGAFEFVAPQREQAPAYRQAVLDAQQRLFQAESSGVATELAALDPLRDSGIPSPLMPEAPMRPKVPGWTRFAIPLALGVGLVVGAGLWLVRNSMSEKRLYAAAREKNDVAGYQAYLARGGERREVRDILLPRAELQEARRQGTVEAIRHFIDEHPKTVIQAEVMAALREALLKRLAAAKKAGTLSALRQLGQNTPYVHLIRGELDAATRAVFKRALSKFRAAAARDNSKLVPFFQRLLNHAQKHGPRVEIRFRQLPIPAEEQVDGRVRSNPYYLGVASLPSQYFKGKYAHAREQATGQAIAKRLQAVFPKDVLEFAVGAPLPEGKQRLPKPKVPTLFVEHRVTLSGNYLSDRPKGVYVGVALSFKATFRIPKSKKRLFFKHSVWRPPNIKKIQDTHPSLKEVYEELAGGGYERFTTALLGFFLEKP